MLRLYGVEVIGANGVLTGGTTFWGGLRMLGDWLGLDGDIGIQGTFARPGEGIGSQTATNQSSSHHDDDDRPRITFHGGTHDPNKTPNQNGGVKGQIKQQFPILLDLDGDGIEITELDRSTVFMDSEGTGLKNRTAWAGAGDGVLFYDADNDGLISDDREYVFTEWDATAADDLAALRSRFDKNGDGKLTLDELDKFKVVETGPNGQLVTKTLATLGITEIRLTPDTTQIAFEDGSAITGQATFVKGGNVHTLANATLATESDAHRVVESVTTSGGNRTVTQTGYDSAGDVVFVTTSTTNAAGTSITNRYDDNGDGVVDRFQTIVVTTGGAGQKIETETNYLGTSAAGVLSSRQVVTTSADGKTVTIERDPMGGGWFSAREVRVTNVDGSRSETLSRLVPDGTAIETTSVTISANGLVRTVLTDLKADAAVDHRVTEAVTVAGDGSRTEVVTVRNGDNSLRGVETLAISADGRTRVTGHNLDGGTGNDLVETETVTLNADGSTVAVRELRNANGTLRAKETHTTSNDGLVVVSAVDADGDGDIDTTTTDTTTLTPAGDRYRTVTVTNGDGSLRSMERIDLGPDHVSGRVLLDLNRNGAFSGNEYMSATTVDAGTGAVTTWTYDRNPDASLKGRTQAVANAAGNSIATSIDRDGDLDWDDVVTDVTSVDGSGIATRVVTTTNGDGSLRSMVTETTSANGLQTTRVSDVDGDGSADEWVTQTWAKGGDGSRTLTTVTQAGDHSTLLSKVTAWESANRLSSTVTTDANGDGQNDRLVQTVKAASGVTTITDTSWVEGVRSAKSVTTVSEDGTRTVRTDYVDGDETWDLRTVDEDVYLASGAKQHVREIFDASGDRHYLEKLTTWYNGLATQKDIHETGGGLTRRETSHTTLSADGSTVRLDQVWSGNLTILSRTQVTTSDDGLVVVTRSDADNDGTYELTETRTTVLGSDGGVTTTTELCDAANLLRSGSVETRSDDGREIIASHDDNGDGHIDRIISHIVAMAGTVTDTETALNANGTLQSRRQVVTSDDGLSITTSLDQDGDGLYERVTDDVTVLNANGSTTRTVTERSPLALALSRTMTVTSDEGRSTTVTEDIGGVGAVDATTVTTLSVSPDGVAKKEVIRTARNGDVIVKTTVMTSADKQMVTRASDADGVGTADRTEVTSVGSDGVTTTDTQFRSSEGGLLAQQVQRVTADGLRSVTERDADGDGTFELVTETLRQIRSDGTVVESLVVRNHHHLGVAARVTEKSDTGHVTITRIDHDGDGRDDLVSEDRLTIAANGTRLRVQETFDALASRVARIETTTSGNGLDILTVVDFDGDGAEDRITHAVTSANGAVQIEETAFGSGLAPIWHREESRSADGRTINTTLDRDGDGWTDLASTATQDASGTWTTVYQSYDGGETPESRITAVVPANGMQAGFAFDLDGDGIAEFRRERSLSYAANGDRIITRTEVHGANEVTLSEITTEAANGLTSVTAFDNDGDGLVDATATRTLTLHATGAQTTSYVTTLADGSLRAKTVVSLSADGRKEITQVDNDGNGVWDMVSTKTTAADGSVTVVDKSYYTNGLPGGQSFRFTSADGLQTTIIRNDGTQVITRSPIDDGSYKWVSGTESSSHRVDALGIETWTHTRDGVTSTARLDATAKSMIIEEAARIYDAVLDRDMDMTEQEALACRIAGDRLDGAALVKDLLASTEFTTRYPGLDAAAFIQRISLNALGREPSLAEVAEHLAALSGTGATVTANRAAYALEIANHTEHVLVGNAHLATNNFDVILNGAQVEREIDVARARETVERLVDVAYDREATEQELDYLSDRLLDEEDHVTAANIAGELLAGTVNGTIQGISSKTLAGLTGSAFVSQAFLNAFGHGPTAAELTTWSEALTNGWVTGSQLVAALALSTETLASGGTHLTYTAPTVTTGSVTGTSDQDSLTGTSGNDVISGFGGSDRLSSGAGNDTMKGDGGSDIYLWGTADGNDTINDTATSLVESDVLVLDSIAASAVTLTRIALSENMLITIAGSTSTLTIIDQFASLTSGKGLEAIRFQGGITWDRAMITEKSSITSNAANIGRGNYTEHIYGEEGYNLLNGSSGNDHLSGGEGNDSLRGGGGSDTYTWQRDHNNDGIDDGNDTIEDASTGSSDLDVLILHGVAPEDVTLKLVNDEDVQIHIARPGPGQNDAIITDKGRYGQSGFGVDLIRFDDGSTWQVSEILMQIDTTEGSDLGDNLKLSDDSDGTANDFVTAGAGDDTIYGFGGNDYLDGGAGSDTYVWRSNIGVSGGQHGNDRIRDNGSATTDVDTLFLQDVLSTQVTLERRIGDSTVSNENLLIRVALDEDTYASISLFKVYSGSAITIERILFADDEEWLLDEIEHRTETSGTVNNDTITGGTLDDNIFGDDGRDSIDSGSGDDEIEGGTGSDSLNGGAGNDIYYWSTGDGADEINDSSTSTSSIDVLVLRDIDPDEVELSKSGSDLIVDVNGVDIKITGRFSSSTEGRGIEKIVFADGVVVEVLSDPAATAITTGDASAQDLTGWGFRDVMNGMSGDDTLSGGNGNDDLNGGAGNDTLKGGAGSDTYIWSTGDGRDRIEDGSTSQTDVDILYLADAESAKALLHRPSNDTGLYVYVDGILSTVIANQFGTSSRFGGIEAIRFADGTSWNHTQIEERTRTIPQDPAPNGIETPVYGSAWNDYILGRQGANIDHADILYGGTSADNTEAGDDTFQGFGGADTLYDDSGNETYIWSKGDGNDIIADQGKAVGEVDRLILRNVASTEVDLVRQPASYDLSIIMLDGSGTITAANMLLDSYSRGIEVIEFSDGVIWAAEEIRDHIRTTGTAANDSITGTVGRDRIFGGDGVDLLYGGDGDDRLDGGAGIDTLFGGAGDDEYVWRLGDGNDRIVDGNTASEAYDTLRLVDVDSTGVQLRRSPVLVGADYLNIYITGQTSVIQIDNQFDGPGIRTGIERIVFQDGVVWDVAMIEAQTETHGAGTVHGGAHNDNLYGTTGAETLLGKDGDDVLIGGAGADRLDGGFGVDIVSYRTASQGVWVNINLQDGITAQTGFAGGDEAGDILSGIDGVEGSAWNDKLAGTNNPDDLWGLAGNDTLHGFDGFDRLYGGDGNDTLYGEDFSDLLVGGAGNDTLYGQADADTLDGGTGNDHLVGDTGDDTYIVDSMGDIIFENAGNGTTDRVMASVHFALGATADIEEMMTTDLLGTTAINLTGNALSQTITGNNGINFLNTGGTAVDTLIGRDGNDTYTVFLAGDVVVETAGGGIDTLRTDHSRTLAADQEIEVLTASDLAATTSLHLTGNAGGQTIIGNNGVNVLNGGGSGGAVDTFIGHGGNDDYILGNSADKIEEVAGGGVLDRVFTDVSFALAADNDIEYMRAYTLASTAAINLTGNALAQTIIGNAGNNILSDGSGAAADTLEGGAGNDTYIVRHAGAIIVEIAGNGTTDRVRAEVSFSLAYDDDVERFEATQPAATSAINLTGNVVAQTIIGNAGANRLDGRGANDTLTGLAGDDTFVFSTAPGAANVDLITDFGDGDDLIELKAAAFTALSTGTLVASAYTANTSGQATAASQRIIYETDTGFLFYDEDGTGAAARVQFAALTLGTTLGAGDFLVA